jgi:hypothetical protein
MENKERNNNNVGKAGNSGVSGLDGQNGVSCIKSFIYYYSKNENIPPKGFFSQEDYLYTDFIRRRFDDKSYLKSSKNQILPYLLNINFDATKYEFLRFCWEKKEELKHIHYNMIPVNFSFFNSYLPELFELNINLRQQNFIDNVKKMLISQNDRTTRRHKKYDSNKNNKGHTLTIKVDYGKISEILKTINNNNEIKNVKIVRIFSTFTLEFDTDYKLDKNKYKTNAPDLVIISPKVIAEKPITIDLSCENIPGYPDNLKKAKNGYSSGENGYDGKPGLPGYNAGNLIILADSITNLSNLQTNLAGGTGGPGQDGILQKKSDFFSSSNFYFHILRW